MGSPNKAVFLYYLIGQTHFKALTHKNPKIPRGFLDFPMLQLYCVFYTTASSPNFCIFHSLFAFLCVSYFTLSTLCSLSLSPLLSSPSLFLVSSFYLVNTLSIILWQFRSHIWSKIEQKMRKQSSRSLFLSLSLSHKHTHTPHTHTHTFSHKSKCIIFFLLMIWHFFFLSLSLSLTHTHTHTHTHFLTCNEEQASMTNSFNSC